ncbi:MAG TPA: hypothetical protein VNZ03_08315 [Terriglobales bacterium]|jgi:hypothetical protein|nr:hypothetical protein [Terriglobales bacterium]
MSIFLSYRKATQRAFAFLASTIDASAQLLSCCSVKLQCRALRFGDPAGFCLRRNNSMERVGFNGGVRGLFYGTLRVRELARASQGGTNSIRHNRTTMPESGLTAQITMV